MEKILDFYSGYEGEGEITFTYGENDHSINIWEGFFYDIMTNMLNCLNKHENNLESIAYYYNIQAGWYDESPWQVENLETALKQFNIIKIEDLEYQKSRDVLKSIIELLNLAVINNQKVYINYD